MISFFLSLVALIVGYLVYGRIVERVFGPDDRPTPAVSMADGVDYIKMPTWRVFMVQFLNIAGTGPIFGAILGAIYGPASYLWIVFGCIFGGAVHDFFSGMLSVRHGGANLPELVRLYLGNNARKLMLVFSVVLLSLVGVVYVYTPALILKDMWGSTMFWVLVIFVYYILATLLPIDKIIGRFYPIFAIALLFMAVALAVSLFIKQPAIPELWSDMSTSNLNNPASLLGADSYIAKNPLFPCLFITIACGAVSGFHGTQSPLMARCISSERMGRPVFYGAMITEGVVALIWASVSSYFFYCGGWREVVDPNTVNQFLAQVNTEGGKNLVQFFAAPSVVENISVGWLGIAGGILAIFGVVAAPITSGDTAFRSARLIIAEALHLEQKTVAKRFYIAIPMFAVAVALLAWQMEDNEGFNKLWQWFGWSNQTLATFTLWTITVYLAQSRKAYGITLVPALFMTTVVSTFLFVSPMAFGLDHTLSYILGLICLAIAFGWFFIWYRKFTSSNKLKN